MFRATVLSVVALGAMTIHSFATCVVQENIHETICAADWGEKHGAPAGYLEEMKKSMLSKSPEKMQTWDLEYLMPMELGGNCGNPLELQNLKLMPLTGECGATVKRRVTRDLRDLVCRGAVTLDAARVIAFQHWCAPYTIKWIEAEKGKTKP